MPFTTLEIELNNQVATIWMNRPDLHNAFDETLITELTAACMALDDDADVRVVVLAGRGKSFSAGADLNWMKRAANNGLDDNLNDARALAHMLRTLAEMKKPTIARVQGAALGGGMGLASACDIAVASTKAVFATSEVKFGIIPSAISPYVLRAIGARQAYRYFQSAERIDAVRAREATGWRLAGTWATEALRLPLVSPGIRQQRINHAIHGNGNNTQTIRIPEAINDLRQLPVDGVLPPVKKHDAVVFSQFRNGLSLLRLVCRQLVPDRAVVMAVLQVIVQFGMRQHGFFGAHGEKPGLLSPVILQPEIFHKIIHAGIQNGFVQRPLCCRLQRGQFLHNIRLLTGGCRYRFIFFFLRIYFLVIPLPACIFP